MTRSHVLTIDETETGPSQQGFPQPAKLSSRAHFWRDISLEYYIQQGPANTGDRVVSTYQLILSLPHPHLGDRLWIERESQSKNVHPEDILIVPAGVRHRFRWEHKQHFLILSFSPSWIERINQEFTNGECSQLIDQITARKDTLIQGILLGLKQELESNGPGGEAYVDHLRTTLAVHLLRNYTTCPIDLELCASGLSRSQIRKALHYIQENLHQTIKLDDIAQTLHMSRYYFCRLFRDSMGVSPHKYVINQRIERAKQKLRETQPLTITEIAIDCGFSNQSHFCKYFRQLVGTTPSGYRKKIKESRVLPKTT